MFTLNKELEDDFFNISEDDLSLFDNSTDLHIDRKKSLYGSILYSYRMLNENEKQAFEKLSLFPDGINIENFKFLSSKSKDNNIKKAFISDKIIRKLQNKSLIEETKNNIKLQSIIGRFAEEQFKKRKKNTDFFNSVFNFNAKIIDILEELTFVNEIEKNTIGLRYFENYQNNFLKTIEYIEFYSVSDEAKIDYLSSSSQLFIGITSITNFINILAIKFSLFKNESLKVVELILENARYFDGHFDDAFNKIKKIVPFDNLQSLDLNDPLESHLLTYGVIIYSMEGKQAQLLNILPTKRFKELKKCLNIELGIFEDSLPELGSTSYFKYLFFTNTDNPDELDKHLNLLHKKEHISRVELSYLKAKRVPYDKEYINQLVEVNPFTFGLKRLMLAFSEDDVTKAKFLYKEGVSNLKHIKFYYVEALYLYAKFLKKNKEPEYNDIYLDGHQLAKEYCYRYLDYLFDELENPTGLVYDTKHYPRTKLESVCDKENISL